MIRFVWCDVVCGVAIVTIVRVVREFNRIIVIAIMLHTISSSLFSVLQFA